MTDGSGRRVRSQDLQRLAELLQHSGAEVNSLIEGFSMAPTLPPGSHIRIRCVLRPALRRGSVVAFVHGERLMAHRLVRAWPHLGWALTRGDGSAVCDPPLPLSAVIGHVIAWRPDAAAAWGEVPAAPISAAPRRWVIACSEWATGAITKVSPRAAQLLALAALRLRGLLLRARQRLT